MPEQKTMWVAKDGATFSTEREAGNHEVAMTIESEVRDILSDLIGDCVNWEDIHPIVMRIVSVIMRERAARDFYHEVTNNDE